MFGNFREYRYQKGCSDRDAGLLPRIPQDSAYLDGYLSDRPKGLDEDIEYFATVEEYLNFKQKQKKR